MDKNIIIILVYLIFYLTFGKLLLLLPCLFLYNIYPDSKKLFYYLKNTLKLSISFLFKLLYPLRINVNSLKLLKEINSQDNKKNIIISNHLSEIDPFILNIILEVPNNLYQNQINVSKKIIGLLIPSFGAIGLVADEIFLERNINIDKCKLDKKLNFNKFILSQNNEVGQLLIKDLPTQGIFYPEGTCFNKERKNISDLYCNKNNLPIFKYHIYPRIKGLELIIKNNLDVSYVYDLTFVYDTISKKKYGCYFTFLSFLNKYKFPCNIYINISKYKIKSTDNIRKKLENIYVNKDKFIRKFNYNDNNFTTIKYNNYFGMINFIFINLISSFSIYLFYKSIIIRYIYFYEFIFFLFNFFLY